MMDATTFCGHPLQLPYFGKVFIDTQQWLSYVPMQEKKILVNQYSGC
jgi:hypothetical protein